MRRILCITFTGEFGNLADAFDQAEIELLQSTADETNAERIREADPEVVIVICRRIDSQLLKLINELRAFSRRLPIIVFGDLQMSEAHQAPQRSQVFDLWPTLLEVQELVRRTEVALKTAHDSRAPVGCHPGPSGSPLTERIVGASPAAQTIAAAIDRVAGTDADVLVTGESGTGKTLVAKAIHHQSHRKEGFFVTLDCAIEPTILDRDLFGSAHAAHPSRLEQAAGGTLFLRHIESMPLFLQSRLIQWLEERESAFSRQRQSLPRLIGAATGPNELAVPIRVLSEELFRRLSSNRIELPPLRERLEDLPPLASYFLDRFASSSGGGPKSLSLIVNRVLSRHRWPDNIREVESVLKRAAAFASADLIQLGDLPSDLLNSVGPRLLGSADNPPPGTSESEEGSGDLSALSYTLFQWARRDTQFQVIPAIERQLIVHAMAETRGNQVQASKLLGITRATLRKRLRRFNIRREVLIH